MVRWTDEIAEQTARSAAAEEAVQQAISAGDETVLFQPVVDLRTGAVSGVEALVRLGGPAAELPTDLVLAASHRLGLTASFAERIYELAFSNGLRLRSVFPGCLLNINVSREFLSTGLAIDTVLATAGRFDIPLVRGGAGADRGGGHRAAARSCCSPNSAGPPSTACSWPSTTSAEARHPWRCCANCR